MYQIDRLLHRIKRSAGMGFQTDDVTSCVDDRPGEVTRIRYVIRA